MRLTFPAGRPGKTELAITALAGALVSAGQAPLMAWYVAFPALIWLCARILRAKGAVAAAWMGWFGGAGYFAASLSWIVSPFFVEPWTYGWMAPFALVLMAFGLALFWGLAAGLARRMPGPALALAAALALAELARGFVFTGFPWALIGHIWLGTWLEQVSALIGANGLTALTLFAAVAPLQSRRWGTLATAVMMLAMAGFGWMRLDAPDQPDRQASLRLVQPNAEQHLKWDPAEAGILFQRQLDFTRQGTPAMLTIWPETAVPYLLEYSPEVGPIITAASNGNPVAVGIQRVTGSQGWNSLRILQGAGEVTATYDKFHLVPFGEYMPMGDLLHDWFGIGAFAAKVGNGYSAGSGPQVLNLGPVLGKVLPLICYEAVFPEIPRHAATRPDWMLQITNDAWFGTLTGPFQHFELARLRAIEQGLPLIRVANTGVTAVIDAKGRVRQALPFATAAALDVPGIPAALAPTPYARWGEIPAILLIAGLFGMAMARQRPKIA